MSQHSGKHQVACLRCGKCCLADMLAFATDEDTARWKREGRTDILHVIENQNAVWAGDHLVSAADGTYITGCPFLVWDGNLRACSIYETKPGVCSDFVPGSSEICRLFKKDFTGN